MTTATSALGITPGTASYAARILTLSATIWLTVATAGQWLFGYYILAFYGKSTINGDFDRWNDVLPHGYVAGDWSGNLIVGLHVLLASILVVGGPLQLMPPVRRRFPVFHRWLGRLYVITAIVVSTAGFIMVWTRGSVGDLLQHITISLQAIYIVVFALLTIRHARQRQFTQHRTWAMRLFMVVNGVWFFRVGLMCWLVINGGPAGFDPKTFTGPFLTVLSIFTYAVPVSLLGLELYWFAEKSRNKALLLATSAIIFLLTLLMGIGISGATMGMWLPRI